MNSNFLNCSLKSLKITIEGNLQTTSTSLFVEKSELGSHITVKDAQVMFENCTVNFTEISGNKTFIKAFNSTVRMKDINIDHFQGQSFVDITAGTGYITNVSFMDCLSTVSLIMVFNNSLLSLDNCSFCSNKGPQLIVENSSAAIVNNSIFQSNINLENDAISKMHLLGGNGGNLFMITNSHFVNNTFSKAAVMSADKGIGIIENSTFSDNRAKNVSGATVVARNSFMRINGSTFSQNHGSAIAVKNTNVVISNCHFKKNVAKTGAGLILYSNASTLKLDTPEASSVMNLLRKRYPGFGVSVFLRNTRLAPVYMKQQQTIYRSTFEETLPALEVQFLCLIQIH